MVIINYCNCPNFGKTGTSEPIIVRKNYQRERRADTVLEVSVFIFIHIHTHIHIPSAISQFFNLFIKPKLSKIVTIHMVN